MIEVKIVAESAAVLQGELVTLLEGMNTPISQSSVTPANVTPLATDTTAAPKKPRGRPSKKDAVPQITANPEDRQEPEAEDSAEDQAQDEADEAADSAKSAQPETITHDHIRNKLGEYVKKFGMPAAQEDGPLLIQAVLKKLGKQHDGKGKISDLPDEQPVLELALAGVNEMIAKNPYKRAEQKAA